ncbi:hypothetical protein Bca4012_078533 [Brassica carinata]
MESSNEISINVPAVQPSNPVESLGLPLALNCPSGPTVIDMQGNEGGAFLPCADSHVRSRTPLHRLGLLCLLCLTYASAVCRCPYTQPRCLHFHYGVSISSEARSSAVVTNTTSSQIPSEAETRKHLLGLESISVSIQAETQFVPSLGSGLNHSFSNCSYTSCP